MGLLYGMHYQLGNFDECVNTHRHRVDGTIRGQYCLANISLAHHHGENVVRRKKINIKFVILPPPFRPEKQLTRASRVFKISWFSCQGIGFTLQTYSKY